ncbi:MAG: J domain-containing protein [Leptolyngbyaceae cyanobacterium bins.59]|nr:J domain-containing protein [Leptolyngbyaceae cyanobacterium bins.59]
MATPNYYDTLDVHPAASQADIKQAYRRLVKLFHPDSYHKKDTDADRIVQINEAYETLGNPHRRRSYDAALRQAVSFQAVPDTRQQRAAQAQQRYHAQRRTGHDTDEQIQDWINRVYTPVNRDLSKILKSLQAQVDDLSADPFDDELMEEFQIYLEDSRDILEQAQKVFRSLPNPTNLAGIAAHLYHCLNQVGDGLEELRLFTLNYDDHYLHTGQELFRIANGLRREAQFAMRDATT